MSNTCEYCNNYIYDEEYEEYICDVNMDEDDYARYISDHRSACPLYQSNNEYEIVKKQSFVDLTKGLVYDEKENVYRYIGDVKDNYLEFSGNLFRIIEVDADYNIKAVSEKSFTYMYSGLEKGFNDSYLNEWLNELDSDNSGVFERNLYNTDPLFYTTVCEDVISDVTNITCNKKNKENKIGILSLYEYAKSGGKSGFLNNGEIFYLTNLNDKGSNYYVTSDGEISISELTTKAFGVRPVITISGDTSLLSGKGTVNNPYKIEKHEKSKRLFK